MVAGMVELIGLKWSSRVDSRSLRCLHKAAHATVRLVQCIAVHKCCIPYGVRVMLIPPDNVRKFRLGQKKGMMMTCGNLFKKNYKKRAALWGNPAGALEPPWPASKPF